MESAPAHLKDFFIMALTFSILIAVQQLGEVRVLTGNSRQVGESQSVIAVLNTLTIDYTILDWTLEI